jgi:predicted dehydrogenase
MKFLVIGLGSMGKRRIRNLQYLKAGEIIGFDLREDRCKEAEKKYGIRVFKVFDDAISKNPDVFIISTSPDQHIKYALVAAKSNKHFFTEVGLSRKGIDELITLSKRKNIVAAVSCSMRFHSAVQVIKKLVEKKEIGKILAFTHHCGHFLPNWHPWEDYRSFYVGKRETGGARDMVPFELDWISWILGEIKTISCMKDKLTDLDIDIDDTYSLLVSLENKILGSILIEVISRVPYRVIKLIGEEGVIIWDQSKRHVEIFSSADKKWRKELAEEGNVEKGYVTGEKLYIREMKHFIKAIKDETKWMRNFADEKKMLEILYAAERSSEKGAHVKLEVNCED